MGSLKGTTYRGKVTITDSAGEELACVEGNFNVENSQDKEKKAWSALRTALAGRNAHAIGA